MSCAFCGRENEAESRFCIDCGKPINLSAARVGPAYVPRTQPSGGQPKPYLAPSQSARALASREIVPSTRESDASARCLRCAKPVNPALPFCAHCGTRVTGTAEQATLRATGPKLALIGETREVIEIYHLDRGEAVVGRGETDISFPDDHFMSPLHARLDVREGRLFLRDLGSRNGTWIFIDQPERLNDSDLVLIGAQLLRFRRLAIQRRVRPKRMPLAEWGRRFRRLMLPSWNNFVPMGAFATSFICRRDGLSRSDGRSAIGSSPMTPR